VSEVVVVRRSKNDAGWHMLTEEQYQKVLIEYTKMSKNQDKGLYHAKAIDGLGE